MNSFLFRVAETYHKNYEADINKFTFVFPNRRAGLFFRKFLSELIEKPVFAPEIITVNDCFATASRLQQADRINMLFRLYEIYKRLSGSIESFDTFAFWGEMLLSDFNEVDRYMVDARQLFTNVTELKEIGDMFEHLTENQIKAIRQFWKDFQKDIEEKKAKQDFVEIWKVLYDIYNQFSEELINENSGSDGMISREVAERCKKNEDIEEWEGRQFVFVGFNALNPCESQLMKYLKNRNQADFYWDYESALLHDSENPASHYYHENRLLFPSKFDIIPEFSDLSEKKFVLISVPSTTGQAKAVVQILDEIAENNDIEPDWIHTAVVLPDENLLMPVLNSVSQHVEKVNVTMGYPLTLTPLSGLVESLFELQKRKRKKDNQSSFYFRNVISILQHQYINALCQVDAKRIISLINSDRLIYIEPELIQNNELLKLVFQVVENPHEFARYLLNVLRKMHEAWLQTETDTETILPVSGFVYMYYTTVNRLNDVLNQYQHIQSISFDTVMRIIRQLISGVSVPFTGEPLEGLQVMGVLETRGLDFENLIITSFNEGVFPKKSISQSYIPYSLRKCFELPIYEHQDAIMSYNFYRLLQRAKQVYMIYDSRSEGVRSGEVSRFLYQLKYHYNINIELRNTNFDLFFNQAGEIKINKTDEILFKLQSYLQQSENAAALSASSINNYVSCPLRFYLSSIEKLKETEEISEMPGDDVFGSVFHAVMEYVYEPFKGKIVTIDTINSLLAGSQNLKRAVYKAIAVKYLKKSNPENFTPEGNLLLISEVLYKYLVKVLETDKKYAPFRYINSEEELKVQIPISAGNVNITGYIDRIDEKEGIIRILDYKTGTENLKFKNIEEVFSHEKPDRNTYVLQTMLYGLYYSNKEKDKVIEPGLYFIRKTFSDDFSTRLICKPDRNTTIEVADFKDWIGLFKDELTNCLEEIFNPEIPFFQTPNPKNCEYCSFTGVCKR